MPCLALTVLLLAAALEPSAQRSPEDIERMQRLAEEAVLQVARRPVKGRPTVDFDEYSLRARHPVFAPSDHVLFPDASTGRLVACDAQRFLEASYNLVGPGNIKQRIEWDQDSCFETELEPGPYQIEAEGQQRPWRFEIVPGRPVHLMLHLHNGSEIRFDDVVVKVDAFGPEGYLGFHSVSLQGGTQHRYGTAGLSVPFHRTLPIEPADRALLDEFVQEFARISATPELGEDRFDELLGESDFPAAAAFAWYTNRQVSGDYGAQAAVFPPRDEVRLLVSSCLRLLPLFYVAFYSGVHQPLDLDLEKLLPQREIPYVGKFAKGLADKAEAWLRSEGMLSHDNLSSLREVVRAAMTAGLVRMEIIDEKHLPPVDSPLRAAQLALSGTYALDLRFALLILARSQGGFKIVDLVPAEG